MMESEEKIEDLDRVRSLDHWNLPEFRYENVEVFESSVLLRHGIHSINEAGLPIDLYMDIKPGCPLVFFFNGAKVRNEELKLPFFAGLRVLPPGAVSRVYINDPSLYLNKNLTLGWYAGSKHLRLQEVLPKIIKHTVELARPSKIIFTGGSGGGFASLYYSRLFPGSLAVVWNPQTNILKFYPRHIDEYGKAAFGLHSLESAEALLPNLIQTDLCSLYSATDQGNFILYLQNRLDEFHVQFHLIPFLANMAHPSDPELTFNTGKISDRLYVHSADWGEGHVTPPSEFLTRLYGNLVNFELEWAELLSSNSVVSNVISK